MAIIYSYPENNNILPTDILVGTSTALINGKPKNQTKNISIAELTAYMGLNNVNLNDVLTNGNTSLLSANIGQLGLFDAQAQNYGILELSSSDFNFYNASNILTNTLASDSLILYPNSYFGQLLVPNTITANRVYTLPNATGTIALTSDIPVVTGFVPYIGATQAVDLGAFNLTVNSISVGKGAGTGANNVVIGSLALSSNTTGSQNISVGNSSLRFNSTGTGNTAIGFNTLNANTVGGGNVAVGSQSLLVATSGSDNTAVGTNSLRSNTFGGLNTAVGHGAMFNNISGQANTAFGLSALRDNTTGGNNVAIGSFALFASTTASTSTAVGYEALRSTNGGVFNTAIGSQSMRSNTTGNSNVSVGDLTMFNNTTGTDNTAIGRTALNANTVGINNTAIGSGAIGGLTSGSDNTVIGTSAMSGTQTGSSNVALGLGAGRYFGTGSSNNLVCNSSVFIGHNAVPLLGSQTNQIVIGAGAVGAGSNTVTLGNTSITTTILRGKVGIGTSTPGVNFVNSGAPFSSGPTLGSGTVGSQAILSNDGLYGLYSGVSSNGDVWQQVQRNDGIAVTYNLALQPNGGNIYVGTNAPIYGTSAKMQFLFDGLSEFGINFRSTAVNSIPIHFTSSTGTQTGYIFQDATSVSLVSISDYRLKEDLKPFNGLDLISKINIYDYKWKNQDKRSYGVMAHELQEVVPQAAFGEKDAEKMQGVDYSTLVPILIQAIKEQQTQIEELKILINK
jgi:hypothetical protein